MEYLKRICEKELSEQLEAFGAVLIDGPKWCGKTTTAKRFAKSYIELQDPDMRDSYLETAKVRPSNLLKGENPRLIDEWQEAPNLWDTVRVSVDRRNEEGLYILTGSNSVDIKEIAHTGTGRISSMKMYPMSLYESRESNGTISLEALFSHQGEEMDAESELSFDHLVFAACRGGWPASLSRKSDHAKLLIARNYFDGVCDRDIGSVDGVKKDPTATRLLLRSYARNISTFAGNRTILKDINSNFNMSETVFYEYVKSLKRLFVLDDVEAWCPAIRSKSAIQATDKREFADPSIAVAALGVDPDYFNLDLKTFGFIFENLCIRDLRIYSAALGGHLSYYHDRYGLEADAVLHLRDGRYALIEFKLGSAEIDMGAEHLLKIEELVKKYNASETQAPIRLPDLKMVITGTKYGYKREDGVYVVPIGCLKD